MDVLALALALVAVIIGVVEFIRGRTLLAAGLVAVGLAVVLPALG